MLARRWLLCAFLLLAPHLLAQPTPKLKLVVILTRHGVRSPLNPMSAYAKDPWPDIQNDWHVECCGDLTPRGAQLVTLLGDYYRHHYADQGLLPKAACPAQWVYIWADNEERTLGTANALGKGISGGLPGCVVTVQSLNPDIPPCSRSKDADCQRGKSDPVDALFHPLSDPKLGPPDPAKLQRIVDDINKGYDQLQAQYLQPLQALQDTLGCCSASKCPTPSCNLLSLPHQASTDGKSVTWPGAFNIGSTASEIFLLEYANGMPCDKAGWGRVVFGSPDCTGPGRRFRQMQEIHTAYFQVMQRNTYLAQIQGSNLVYHILQKLRQGIRSPVGLQQKLVIFSGHDTNIANVAAMLGLNWKPPDLPENDTPPAGALVFELYSGPGKDQYFVRVRYVHQILRQLRTKAILRHDPPNWANLTMHLCEADCDFQKFEKILRNAIDPKFVSQTPLKD